LLFTLALLTASYLALPDAGQNVVQQVARSMMTALGATGLRVALEVVFAVSVAGGSALLFAPGSRHGRYLMLQGEQSPSVAVYMDGENVTDDRHIQAIVSRLRRHYSHRRLEMLFFAQVSGGQHTKLHRKLYLFGFRPIQVPHDPTGTNRINEAADKELVMHALQRALIGPAQQEFILIARDGGYVPLVYRLAALGHNVQVWSPDPIEAYRILREYLKIEVVNLSREQVDASPDGRRVAMAASSGAVKSAAVPSQAATTHVSKRFTFVSPPPAEFSQPGIDSLYSAVYNTVELARSFASQEGAPSIRRTRWFTALDRDAHSALAAVGYSGSGRSSHWLSHLVAVDALEEAGRDCPSPGDASAQNAAMQLYAMALAAAQAACQARPNLPDGATTMQAICAAVHAAPPADATLKPLCALADPHNPNRLLTMWFLLHSARALLLLDFDEEPASRIVIRSPRLTTLARSLIAPPTPPAPPAPPASE